jgi:protein TonB
MKQLTFFTFLLLTINSLYGQIDKPYKTSSSEMPHSTEERIIFKVVEDMPRFPGCEHLSTKDKIKKCAEDLLAEYIESNLEYPEEAIDDEIEGKVYVQFIINEDGSISEIAIVRDIGWGCGEAAYNLMTKMKEEITFIPGKQRGVPRPVLFTLPVKFRLNDWY